MNIGLDDNLRHCYIQMYHPFHERFVCRVCFAGYKVPYSSY